MANDVVLSAALRNNLLSLQTTQRLIDTVQLRLATGLKVSSALDGPQQFFTSQALNNRAADLSRLLDGINLSIRTIEEADKGVSTLSDLVNQAQAVADSARDELASSTGEARALGSVDLSATATIIGVGGIAANDVIRIITTDSAGAQVAENITLTAGDSAYTLAQKITDQFADNREGQIVSNITTDGFLEIKSTDGRTFKLTANAAGTDINAAGWTALGLDRYIEDESRAGATLSSGTIIAGSTFSSISLYESTGNLVDAGDVVVGSTLTDANGTTVFSNYQVGDSFTFTVNNSGTITSGAIALTATTSFQDVIDQINLTSAINQYVEAEFDSTTGKIKFTALRDSVENLQIIGTNSAVAATRTFDIGLGDPNGNLDAITSVASATQDYVFSFNNSTSGLDSLQSDFNNILRQIDSLVEDANFRGVNLLGGDELTTFFNEDNSNFLTTTGLDLSSSGLGLTDASFRGETGIELSVNQTISALATIRNFGASLSNNLSIIQTRRNFTENTIGTLKAGAGDLVNADQNEEGANLLALQTRQQLGVTALSLAAQSQQSVLRLF